MPDKLYYSNGSAFQAVAYYKIGHKKQYDVLDLASFMSIGREYAYKLIGGTKPITADIAKKIIEFTYSKNREDRELLEFFCPEGIVPVPLAKARPSSNEVEKDLLHLPGLVGQIFDEWREARPDGIDKNEAIRLDKVISRTISKLAEAREKIKREARG